MKPAISPRTSQAIIDIAVSPPIMHRPFGESVE
jgi:hypothetical protein